MSQEDKKVVPAGPEDEEEFADDSHLPDIKGPGKPNLEASYAALTKATDEYFKLHPEEDKKFPPFVLG